MNRLPLRNYAFTISLTLSGCVLSSYNEGSLGSSAGGSPQGGGGTHTGGASSVSKGGSTSGGVSIVGGASSGGTRGNGGSAAAAGATITGGSKSAGGSVSTGGLQSSGGANASGGQPSGGQSTGSGGTVFTGGVASTGGLSSIGGTRATGGSVSTGGSRPNGGTAATGGSPITGGAVATGGSRPTGGTVATGGVATGGTVATGGVATGGAVPTGGTPATGGSPPTGGAPATGGTCSGTGGSGGLADCDYKGSPCTHGWYSGAPAMVSADVSQSFFLWHVKSGTMLLWPIILNAGDTVQSLGVVTSLATSATPATFQLALYANSDPLSLAVPAALIVETDDLQSAGGDNICTNNVPVKGPLTASPQYTASVATYAWIALLVKGNNDVVIVGANSASSEPTRCASPITPLSLPGSAPTTTTSNCAPPNRGAYSGATPYLFAVVSPSG